jgi:chromosome segregation ATPase
MIFERCFFLTGKYDKHVTGRISRKDYEILQKSGHSVRDAIEFFNREYSKDHRKAILRLKSKQLNDELDEYKKRYYSVKMEIKRLEKEIQDINKELGTNNEELSYHDEKIEKAIDSIRTIFDSRRALYNNVLELDDTIFEVKADNLGISVDEFKNMVVECVE